MNKLEMIGPCEEAMFALVEFLSENTDISKTIIERSPNLTEKIQKAQIYIESESPLQEGTCKGCLQEIFWGVTMQQQKNVPVDPPTKSYILTPKGLKLVNAFYPHFATCQFSDKFRK